MEGSLLDLAGLVCQHGEGPSAFRLEVPELTLFPGEAIAITGPSGCGKSTLLDILGLVRRPTSVDTFRYTLGGISADMAPLWRKGSLDRLAGVRAESIGYVLQTGGLLPFLSVRENIALSLDLLGRRAPGTHLLALVETLGLGGLLDRKPKTLSIGERQRVAIARALAHGPALLLADEPTAALDPAKAHDVLGLLMELVHVLKIALVVVSHDWPLLEGFGLRRIEAEGVSGTTGPVTRFRG